MKNIIDDIKKLNNEIFEQIVNFRENIHQNPELSFQEFETAKYIKQILKQQNIEYDESFGDNAVIGIINGNSTGACIALRADIDALPINEETTYKFKSKNEGVMHACGHDVHTASLLGTAIILNQIRDHIKGKIILIFQPGEEKCPGGASILVEKGLLEKYNICKIVAQHVLPNLETGKMAVSPGYIMAATNEIHISFEGKGGHAALPSQRSDTVLALVSFIKDLSNYVKNIESDLPNLVAFGKIEANGATNVIPNIAHAKGTMRTFDEATREDIKMFISHSATKRAEEYKCVYDLNLTKGYPSVYNNPELSEIVKKFAIDFIDPENVEELKLRLTAEDFSFYSEKIPGSFYRIGICGNNKGKTDLHNSKFDVDENVFKQSSGLMSYIAINILNNI